MASALACRYMPFVVAELIMKVTSGDGGDPRRGGDPRHGGHLGPLNPSIMNPRISVTRPYIFFVAHRSLVLLLKMNPARLGSATSGEHGSAEPTPGPVQPGPVVVSPHGQRSSAATEPGYRLLLPRRAAAQRRTRKG